MTPPEPLKGLVIIDRDGVINQDRDDFVKSADEWLPLPGSIEAIAGLSNAGFEVAVASNQSGLARGLFDDAALAAMHEKLRRLVAEAGGGLGKIAVCPHGPEDGCDCRKPKPGLLLQLAEHYAVSLEQVPVIGDSLRDLEAASAVGACPVLVLTGNGRNTQHRLTGELADTDVYENLAAAAAAIVESAMESNRGVDAGGISRG